MGSGLSFPGSESAIFRLGDQVPLTVCGEKGVIRCPAEAVYLRSKYGKAGSAGPARDGIKSAKAFRT